MSVAALWELITLIVGLWLPCESCWPWLLVCGFPVRVDNSDCWYMYQERDDTVYSFLIRRKQFWFVCIKSHQLISFWSLCTSVFRVWARNTMPGKPWVIFWALFVSVLSLRKRRTTSSYWNSKLKKKRTSL